MTSKFDDAAASYTRVRPEYPPPLIDALFDRVPDHDPLRTVEVGPATGQLTGALLGQHGFPPPIMWPEQAVVLEITAT